jgi:hypothetical protein
VARPTIRPYGAAASTGDRRLSRCADNSVEVRMPEYTETVYPFLGTKHPRTAVTIAPDRTNRRILSPARHVAQLHICGGTK